MKEENDEAAFKKARGAQLRLSTRTTKTTTTTTTNDDDEDDDR